MDLWWNETWLLGDNVKQISPKCYLHKCLPKLQAWRTVTSDTVFSKCMGVGECWVLLYPATECWVISVAALPRLPTLHCSRSLSSWWRCTATDLIPRLTASLHLGPQMTKTPIYCKRGGCLDGTKMACVRVCVYFCVWTFFWQCMETDTTNKTFWRAQRIKEQGDGVWKTNTLSPQ